jgi:hypothetical protein
LITFFLFILFSTLEYLSSLTLLLVLFRFDVKEHFLKFLVSSVLLSLISNTLIQQKLDSISPIIQLLVFVFLVYIILHVSMFNSIIMAFTIYFIFGLVQTTLIMLYTHFGVVDKIEIYKFSAFITQLSSSFYMFLFALIVYLRHGGFSFIDHKSSKRKVLLFNKSNRVFFIALVVALILFVFVNVLYYNSSHPPYLLISIIFLLTLLTLLYLSLKRDDNHV